MAAIWQRSEIGGLVGRPAQVSRLRSAARRSAPSAQRQKSAEIVGAGLAVRAANAPAWLAHVQRTAGNRAAAAWVQRTVADEAAKTLDDNERPTNSGTKAVFKYKPNAKKTSVTNWQRILKTVKTNEEFWGKARAHIMLGEGTTPPKGFHSKQELAQAVCEPVGNPLPASGPAKAYKQWHRKRGDTSYNNLKISSFFPDNWVEEKIKAAVLLKDAGEEHQVSNKFKIATNSASAFPDLQGSDPTKPTTGQ